MPFESNFANDIIRKIGNAKAGVTYTFQPWKMQKTDANKRPIEGKFIRGVSIKDTEGVKVEKHFTDEMQEKMLPIGGVPLYDDSRSRKEQSSAFYQIYFKVLDNEFKNRLVPHYKNIFSDWANANISDAPAEPEIVSSAYQEQPRTQSAMANFEPLVQPEKEDSFPTLADKPKAEPEDDLPF
jgi:hypothetical protein